MEVKHNWYLADEPHWHMADSGLCCIDSSLVSGVYYLNWFQHRKLNMLLSRCIIVYLRCRWRRNSMQRWSSTWTWSDVFISRFSRSGFPSQPHVTQCLVWSHPLWWFPHHTSLDKVHERRLITERLQSCRQCPSCRRTTVFPTPGTPTNNLLATIRYFGKSAVSGNSLWTNKVASTFTRGEEPCRWHSTQLNNTRQLISLILAWKQRTSGGQLGQDTAKTPHINSKTIARTKDHFRGAVEARLDVRVDALVFVTTRPKVYHLHTTHTQ